MGTIRFVFYFLFTTVFALAHPHVFADTKFDIIIDDKYAYVEAYWYFDEMTSQIIVMEYDKNGNGKLDTDEIDSLKKNFFNDLSEFDYYTFAYQNNQPLVLSKPDGLDIFIDGLNVVYRFHTKTTIDLNKNSLKIGSFDKENYTAFRLDPQTTVTIKNKSIKLKSLNSVLEDMDYYVANMLIIKWEGL